MSCRNLRRSHKIPLTSIYLVVITETLGFRHVIYGGNITLVIVCYVWYRFSLVVDLEEAKGSRHF